MAMNKLIAEVTELVEREYGRAGAKFGLTHHSDHESYAVILEELEEAKVEVETVERQLSLFWSMTKCNDPATKKDQLLTQMEKNALFGACELIQVAAMAKKAVLTVCEKEAVKEFKEGCVSE